MHKPHLILAFIQLFIAFIGVIVAIIFIAVENSLLAIPGIFVFFVSGYACCLEIWIAKKIKRQENKKCIK
jgi:uncharacterized membrane protein